MIFFSTAWKIVITLFYYLMQFLFILSLYFYLFYLFIYSDAEKSHKTGIVVASLFHLEIKQNIF